VVGSESCSGQLSESEATMNTTYVIKNKHWNRLPGTLRTVIVGRLKQLYAFAGRTVKVVSPAQAPASPDFNDAILWYSFSNNWHQEFKAEIGRQGRQVQRTHGKLFNMRKVLANIRGRKKTDLQVGDSYAARAPGTKLAACIGLTIVSIPDAARSALNNKQLWTLTRNPRGLKGQALLKKLGIVLGGAGAHEVRHLIAGHAAAAKGLGAEPPDFSADFSKADKKLIKEKNRLLRRQQKGRPTVPIRPPTPGKRSLINVPGTGTRTFNLAKILSTLKTADATSAGTARQPGTLKRVEQVMPPPDYGRSRTSTGKPLIASANPRFVPTRARSGVGASVTGTGSASPSTRGRTGGLGLKLGTSTSLGGGESLIARSKKRQQQEAEQRRQSRLNAARGGQGITGPSITAQIRSQFRRKPKHVSLSPRMVTTSVWEGPIGGPSRLIYHVHEPWPGRKHIDLTRHQGR